MSADDAYIIGIDPGLNITGYGVLRGSGQEPELVEGGVVKTHRGAPLEERLRHLHAGLAKVMEQYPPHIVVVEDLYAQYAHPRTAILMGHARGVAYLAAAQCSAEVVAYPPALVKRSLTGSGRAPKAQVARMVVQILGLSEPPQPDDVTDALALALCHCVPSRQKLERQRGHRKQIPAALAEIIEQQG